MRKFIFILLTVTGLALTYIYQQSKIFYLAYKNEKKKKIIDELIDKNNILRYNVCSFSSLVYLDDKIFRDYAELQMPKTKMFVRAFESNNNSTKLTKAKSNLFSNLISNLTISAEAKEF